MLLWAMFTVGFMTGIFFTLRVFLKDGESDGVENLKVTDLQGLEPWKVHQNLIKVNTVKRGSFGITPFPEKVIQLN